MNRASKAPGSRLGTRTRTYLSHRTWWDTYLTHNTAAHTHTHTQTYTTCMYRNLPVLFGAQELLDPWLYLGLVIFAMYPAPSDDVVFLDYDEKNIYIIIIATIIILSERKSIFINNFKFPHNIYFLLHFLLLSLNWL